MKKKEINGVSFDIEATSYYLHIIKGINVKPGVSAVTFSGDKSTNVELMNVFAQFPDVDTIVIDGSINSIKISNFMFPNVKKVISHSTKFKSGELLIENSYRGKTLLNAFCNKDRDTLDLSEFDSISSYALEGSYITKFINEKLLFDVYHNSNLYLAGTIMKMNPYLFIKDGIYSIGSVLAMIDDNADEIIIPQNITHIGLQKGMDFKKINKVYCSSIDQVKRFGRFINAKELVLDTEERINFSEICKQISTKNVSISDKNKFYRSIDGNIYSKDGTKLILSREEHSFKIPEGVTDIMENAFSGTSIESVECPSSLTTIHEEAFNYSSIKKINLQYVKRIDAKAFYGCNLDYIELPGSLKTVTESSFACNHDTLNKKVVLNEGIECIMEKAFISTGLKEISIPSSVKYMGRKSLPVGIQNIYVKKDYPDDLIMSFMEENYFYDDDIALCCIHIENYGDVYIPKVMSLDNINFLNSQFNLGTLDKEFTNSLYEYASNIHVKQDTAIYVYDITKDENIGKYLRRAGKSIAKRLINENKPDVLIKLVDSGLITSKSMKSILDILPEEMSIVRAYILQQLNEDDAKSSFRL